MIAPIVDRVLGFVKPPGRTRRREYFYFFCIARQRQACDSPYVPLLVAEQAVLRQYEGITLPAGFADRVRGKLDEIQADEALSARLMRSSLTERLATLDRQEESLLDLAVDSSLPREKLRDRLRAVAEEREALTAQLTRTTTSLAVGANVIRGALDLVADIPELYRVSGEAGRRSINQAFFSRLYVEGNQVCEERLNAPFDEVLYLRRGCFVTGGSHARRRPGTRRSGALVDVAPVRETRVGLLVLQPYLWEGTSGCVVASSGAGLVSPSPA